MRQEDNIRIVLGSKRFAGSANVDEQIQVPLMGSRRDMVQGDRSSIVGLNEIFDEERNSSNVFRLSGKIVNIFDNTLSGKTNYTPFKNNLYLIDQETSINTGVWQGYPQYDEFGMIRDRGIVGHVTLVPKSATSYNWSFYVSYPFSSTTAQTMSYTNETFSTQPILFNAGEGIPFTMKTGVNNGKQIVYFYCGTNHNLTAGQSVELNITLGGKNTFQIYSLGDSTYRSEYTVFSIFDLAFDQNDVYNGRTGLLKRILNIENSGESKSRYYVRLHKIITNNEDTFITKLGFENNPFPNKKKLEYSALTPNNLQRVSVKTGTQSYGFMVNKDIDVTPLFDNNNKPITKLYLTIINRGYMGWFNKPPQNQTTALDIGWEFNFLKDSTDLWWDHQSLLNKDNIPVSSYVKGGYTFYYNRLLKKDDIIKGDFCEYNDIEQKEYVLSPIYHKYSLNTDVFFDNSISNYPSGYLYRPHYDIPIRVFSDYIETGLKDEIDIVPPYSYYSNNLGKYIWRDLYTYGFIDGNNLGLNIPFINDAHYPFKSIYFLNYNVQRDVSSADVTIINPPTVDDCE
jgi:hypothetical protein